jgi:hypothetical protein
MRALGLLVEKLGGAEACPSQRLLDAPIITGSAGFDAFDNVGREPESDVDPEYLAWRLGLSVGRHGGELCVILWRGQVWRFVADHWLSFG